MYLSLRNFTFVHVCLHCSIMSSNRKNNEPELKLTEEQTFKIVELYHEETSLWNVYVGSPYTLQLLISMCNKKHANWNHEHVLSLHSCVLQQKQL